MTRQLTKWYSDKFKRELRSELHRAGHQIGAVCVARIQRSMGGSPSDPNNPPGVDTGTYRKTIQNEVGDMDGNVVVRVGSTSKLAPWLELGTGSRSEEGGEAYEIVPVEADVLAFDVDGQTVFAKRVMHPGIHPRPHFRPGVRNSRPAIRAILQKVNL